MTLQEFKDRALEIFPGANVYGIQRDAADPESRLDIGTIEVWTPITLNQIVKLSSVTESRGLVLDTKEYKRDFDDYSTCMEIMVTL
jgi:hypothetical protein